MSNFKTHLSLIIFSISFVNLAFAQMHKDCSDPLILCGESPFRVEFDFGEGANDNDVNNSCVMMESNPLWISLDVIADGDLTFEISPQGEFDDIDFVVFQLENDNCDNKTIVRCMASGESAGQNPTDNSPCWGATGLASGETDVLESAGCSNGSNNYLAPMEVVAGEKYLLLINDFSFAQEVYDISFGGSAELDCMSTSIDENELIQNNNIFTSRTTTDGLYIQTSPSFANGQLSIFNVNGQLLFNQMVGSNEQVIFNDPVLNGLYFVVLNCQNQFQQEKVMVFR